MGSFEKLGILVIVIIIVMILAVAIHQWGGAAPAGEGSGSLIIPSPAAARDDPTVRYIDQIDKGRRAEAGRESGPQDRGTWSNGIPKRYTIEKNRPLWNLVRKKWRLPESFIGRIQAANPGVDFKRMRPGDTLVIPDPGPADPGKAVRRPSGKRVRYEIQEGDLLESIALRFLGSRHLWRTIVEANEGLDPRRIKAGDEIWIPIR